MKKYQKSIRYATKLIKNYNAPYSPRDLVHDAYVQWEGYNNSDLFNQPEGLIMRVIKANYWNYTKRLYYQYKGERFKKQIFVIDEGGEEEVSLYTYIPKEINTPESDFTFKEYTKNINDNLCEFDRKVLLLRSEGYNNKEIKVILNKEPEVKGKNGQVLKVHPGKLAEAMKNIKKQMYTNNLLI